MKRNVLWLIIVFLPFILFYLMSFKTVKEIYAYISLNQKTKSFIENFEIKNDERHRHKVYVSYTFQAKDKIFKNKSFRGKSFLNHLNANDYAVKLSKNDFYIWYNKNNPNISSCEKTFPIKNCVYVFVSFLIVIYFFALKYYVYTFQKNN